MRRKPTMQDYFDAIRAHESIEYDDEGNERLSGHCNYSKLVVEEEPSPVGRLAITATYEDGTTENYVVDTKIDGGQVTFELRRPAVKLQWRTLSAL